MATHDQHRGISTLPATSLVVPGCAMVVNDRMQRSGVSSTPTGATVLIDNHPQFFTPAAVTLAYDRDHTVLFKKDGYQDDSFVLTSLGRGYANS